LNPGARLHRPDERDMETLLSSFCDFCRVDLSLAEATSKEYRRKMRRFLEAVGKPTESVTIEDARSYS